MHPNELEDPAILILDGGNGEEVPEGGAVLLVVEHTAAVVGAVGEGLPDLGDLGRVGAGALEEAAVPADDLLGGVPGHVEEAGAGVHDGVAGLGGVRHHEGLLERRERGPELLGDPGDGAAAGLAVVGAAARGAGGAGGDALGAARLLVGLEHQAPLRRPLRRLTHILLLVLVPGAERGGFGGGGGGGAEGGGGVGGGGVEDLEGAAGVARQLLLGPLGLILLMAAAAAACTVLVDHSRIDPVLNVDGSTKFSVRIVMN